MKVDWERVAWSHPTASMLVVAPRLERLEVEPGEYVLCALKVCRSDEQVDVDRVAIRARRV
jgi:hypothetical protein